MPGASASIRKCKVSVIGTPETGWVRETIKGRVHLRKDGRTVETFANDERCDWHCADHGIEAVERLANEAKAVMRRQA